MKAHIPSAADMPAHSRVRVLGLIFIAMAADLWLCFNVGWCPKEQLGGGRMALAREVSG